MTLPELAAAVVAQLTPATTRPGAPRRANLTAAIMTAFRPYIEHAVTGEAPKTIRDVVDRREKRWLVSLTFTLDSNIVGESEGRVCDADGKPRTYGGDIVTGLDGAADLIAEYAESVKAPEADYGPAVMRKALAYLRPTISRQGGHATMRRTSYDGRWHLIADVFREDVIPGE